MTRRTWVLLLLSAHVAVSTAASAGSQDSPQRLLGDLQEGWKEHWMERRVGDRSTRYEVAEENGNLVLRADSANSASALWRMLSLHPGEEATIAWRWKVERSLSRNDNERAKGGDDYAARLLVIFDPTLFSWRTRAICYVWAGNETVGSVYASPYASSVATVVLESGDDRSGRWITEKRDFADDFRRIFGELPEMVTAVAVMVDTDDTDTTATAWFDDIVLSAGR